MSREWTGLPGLRARDRMLARRTGNRSHSRDWAPDHERKLGTPRSAAFGAGALCAPYETTTVDTRVKDTKAYLGKAVRDAPPPPRGAGRLALLLWRRGLLRWNNTTLVGPGQKRRVVII